MTNPQLSIEDRVEELAEQVRVLGERLDEFARREAPFQPAAASNHSAVAEAPSFQNELSLQWPSANVLQSLAAACFALMVALMLRTVSDSGAIDRGLGLVLGIFYASVLVVYGYRRHARGKPLGSVLAACGLLLLFSIVFEDRVRFEVLSTAQAYFILSVACMAVVLLDRKHVPAIPVCLGVLGSALTGLFLEFPEPHFAYLGVLLGFANVTAYSVRSRPRCRWVKWAVLALTIFFWFLWVLRIRTVEASDVPFGPELALSWLVPLLLFYGALYIAPIFWTLFIGSGRIGRFETLLPAVSLLGAYAVAATVPVEPVLGRLSTPAIGVACGATFLLFAFTLACRNRNHTRAAAAFAVPAVVLLAAALPQAANPIVAMVLWSVAALAVAIRSTAWRARKVRTSTYLLQAYGCGFAIATGVFAVQAPLPAGALFLAFCLAVLSAAHYVWCRWTPSRHDASWVDSFDPYDLTRMLPLFVAAVYAFVGARLLLYVGCEYLPTDSTDAFVCGQTVMISAAAVLLALLALRLMNHELLAAAALVLAVGAAKLLVYDFFQTGGAPLVLGVFSLGLSAALGSLIWRRYAAQMDLLKPNRNALT